MEEPHNTSIPRQEFLPTGGSSFHTAPLSRGFLPADQKSAFICNCLILSCYRILIPNHKIITYIAVSACAAADQLPMELFYPKEIAVAQKRQDVEQIMLLRELRIRTLPRPETALLFCRNRLHLHALDHDITSGID